MCSGVACSPGARLGSACRRGGAPKSLRSPTASPKNRLPRSVQPAAARQGIPEILAERLDLPIAYREDVIELDFGEWTGLTFDAVRKDERWRLWSTCRSIACVPGGESMRQVQERAVKALFELGEAHRDGTVVIVSHGDVIRAALLFALGMPLDFYSRIEVGLASISTIQIDDFGIRVLAVNERPRLRSLILASQSIR